jgi:hypothetical protein
MTRISDLDITLLGINMPDHQAALTVGRFLQRQGDFSIWVKPLAHPQSRPLIAFKHLATGVQGDITFNEVKAVRTTAILSAISHKCPLGISLTVLLKSLVRAHDFGPRVVSSVVLSVTAAGLVAFVRHDVAANGPRSEYFGQFGIAHAFIAYCRFFSSEAFLSAPSSSVISVTGITQARASGRQFLLWNVQDPGACAGNLAQGCTGIAAFSDVLKATLDRVVAHYDEDGLRVRDAAHLMDLFPRWAGRPSAPSSPASNTTASSGEGTVLSVAAN